MSMKHSHRSSGIRRQLRAVVLACCCMLPFAAAPVRAQHAYEPDAVKAAFLYHFGAFVEWPEEAAAANADEFTIAVVGAPAVLEELQRIAPERSIRGKRLAIRDVKSAQEFEQADIVFVGESKAALLSRAVRLAHSRPLLVVTDVEQGLARGAAISFVLRDERVRFEASIPAARRAGLNLSSRLLNVALHVEKTGLLRNGAETQYSWVQCLWAEQGDPCGASNDDAAPDVLSRRG